MPGVYDSLPSPGSDYSETSSHPKEIIIRIYASDEQGRFFATAPVPPPTPPDTTGSSGSDQEKEKERQQQKPARPLRRKLSKAARLRGSPKSKPSDTSTSSSPSTSLGRSISSPIRHLNHSKSAESFRHACEAARYTPHRASQPPQQLQRQDSRSPSHGGLLRRVDPGYVPRANEYDPNVLSSGSDAPLFGSCDKRVRRNRSYESNISPPSKRVDRSQYSMPPVPPVPPKDVPPKDVPPKDVPVPEKDVHPVHGDSNGHLKPLPSLSLEEFRKEIGWPPAVDATNTNAAPAEELLPATRYSGVTPIPTTEPVDSDDNNNDDDYDDPLQPENWGLRQQHQHRNPDRESSFMGWEFNSPHRLLHKAGRITEGDRQKIAAEFDTFADQASETPKRRVDVVPVVVIPQRQSSLSYPATPAAAAVDRRPSTATGDGDWARSAAPFEHIATRSQSARRPAVPPRRSSLSAPTSANNSRAASMSSENPMGMREYDFKRHLAEKPMPHPPAAAEPVRPSMYGLTDDDTQTQSILIGIEDVDQMGVPFAPFNNNNSHDSAPSSPGVVEVNEATAVNLYTRNNESLLVVDRRPSQKKRQGQNKRVDFAAYEGESPKHPRPPPNTPLCHVTPPSPNPSTKAQTQTQGRGQAAQEPMIRRFGSLRRAWSTRTRTQPTNVPKRSFSTSATAKTPETRLHPFWRPRRRNDSQTEAEPATAPATATAMHPPTSHTKQNDNIVKNSLGMPQPRAVMDGPALPARTRSRRETNTRQRPQPPPARKPVPSRIPSERGVNTNRNTLVRGNTTTATNTGTGTGTGTAALPGGPDFINRASRASRHLNMNLRQRQAHAHPVTWGYRVRFGAVTVRNLRRRFNGRVQRYTEKRERELRDQRDRRVKLKRNVGASASASAGAGAGPGLGHSPEYERGYGYGYEHAESASAGVGGRRRRERLTKRR